MTQDMNHTITKVLKAVLVVTMMSLTGSHALAQVKVNGSVFGGGNEADVQVNTTVNISKGTVEGNVYGGGNLGDVGNITKNTTDYNYTWTGSNSQPNTSGNNEISGTNNNTGVSSVNITGSAVVIGPEGTSDENHGNVFGGGKGADDTFWCEKGMVFATNVSISAGTVKGDVFGGGEVGRVEDDTKVTIGEGTSEPDIKGDVFGAGKGFVTHGYSALVRGNSEVTVQAKAKVESNVYGGGDIATVGRYVVVNGVPTEPNGGGNCTVIIKDDAAITGNVVGAGKGVAPSTYRESGTDRSKRMMVYDPDRYTGTSGSGSWAFIKEYEDTYEGTKFVWEYFTQSQYITYLETLALASNAGVTIGGTTTGKTAIVNGNVYGGSEVGFLQLHTQVKILDNCEIGTTGSNGVGGNVYAGGRGLDGYDAGGRVSGYTSVAINGGIMHGSVFGGGENGYVKGGVNVNMTGGTVDIDVYGGGEIADTNTGNGNEYIAVPGITTGALVSGLYEKEYKAAEGTAQTGVTYYELKDDKYVVKTVTEGASVSGLYVINYKSTTDGTALSGKTYYNNIHPTTVNLLGGHIKGDAYGGGLGSSTIAALVYGDTRVNLNGMAISEYKSEFSSYLSALDMNGDSDTSDDGIDYYRVNTSQAGCMVNRIFGANNINGTPKGNVTVHVYATQHVDKATINAKYAKLTEKGTNETLKAYLQRLINATRIDENQYMSGVNSTVVTTAQGVYNDDDATDAQLNAQIDNVKSELLNRYDVKAVYGGGNQAAYIPTTPYLPTDAPSGSKTQVIIDGCDYTSIQTVYGGGNAASVPETNVTINSDYEIESAFGGGNGRDNIMINGVSTENPGADVGQYKNSNNTQVRYGTGIANLDIKGGVIHEAYGGSNKKGSIKGNVNLTSNPWTVKTDPRYCAFNVGKMVGAGNEADIDGDVILVMGCMPTTKTPLIFGGADNANVNGNVELTITSGTFGQVFGGNNLGGYIKGHIILNIEETGCNPIVIDELYLGGNQAAYSRYGYYNAATSENPNIQPRTAAMHSIAEGKEGYIAPVGNPAEDATHTFPYAEPVLNVISCTHIGKVFGGGYGAGATMYANPTVNINQTYAETNGTASTNLGTIGDVYGGGNEAMVEGNTTVNIGTETTVYLTSVPDDAATSTVDESARTVMGANITGDVFGGGNEADVTGNTFVNICAKKGTGDSYTSVAFTTDQVTIGGNVFGGGKGVGDSFTCEKAMVGIDGAGADAVHYPNYSDGNTNIVIGNGKVTGNVYGGGEVGRVEMNTSVTIGLGDGVASGGTVTSAPEIQHSVFGGGKGLETHGYSALVRGNPTVIIQGNAKVRDNVYGGGQIASVARYNVAKTDDEGAPYGVKKDEPYALKTNTSGFCSVTIRGNAEIGPETIGQEKETLVGHVFGAGKGILPGVDYAFVQGTTKRMVAVRDDEGHITGSEWDYFSEGEADYITFIKTLALASQTNVTIDGNALVKGSVFGGSESGFVQFDTNVNVLGGTIGTEGKGGADFGNVYGGGKGDVEYTGANHNYIAAGIVKGNTKVTISETDATNHPTLIYHNIYGGGAYGTVGEFEYDATTGIPTARKTYTIGTEVHSTTGGNTEVYITGGTIGTNGNENGMIFGSSRGDVGIPGSIHDKAAWVYDTHVAIGDTIATPTATTTPLIKGSVYGGGENGHNFHSSFVRINGGTIGITSGEAIGSYTAGGASYPYRGNVYGGGCGTDKYDNDTKYNPLAGIVRGDATIRMTEGIVVHNMYGAGAMGSVGTADVANSGKTTIEISGGTIGVSGTVGDGNVFGAARGDKDDTAIGLAQVRETSVTVSAGQVMGNVYGGGEVGNVGLFSNQSPVSVGNYIWDTSNTGNGLCTVTVSGGKIGPDDVALSKEHGNVFGGGKGVSNTFECEKAMVYNTNVSISNGSTVNGTVYGGGEVGRVENNTVVTIGTENGTDEPEIKGNVFAAGAGTKTHGYSALVRGTSSVTVQGKAKVLKNVYGGGEEASVGRYKVKVKNDPLTPSDAPSTLPVGMPYQLISGGTSTVVIQDNAVIGTDGVNTTGHVYGAGQGVNPYEVAYTYQSDATKPSRMVSGNTWEYFADEAAYLQFVETLALTGTTDVTINEGVTVKGSVFGGSESGFVYHNTKVEIKNGTVNGDAFGGGRGLASFAEAGRVSGNTEIAVSGGAVEGNVYGGGNLGDVGTIKKNTTDYNYTWKNSDCNGNVNATGNDNNSGNNKITGTNKNTGICKVKISGGTIGVDNPSDATEQGNVFGAGEGLATTWWCEKAIAYATDVSVTGGTVKGNVYGGGQIGRVEDDAKVTIGAENGTDEFTISGSVFGAGAGLATHGYSALVRGNANVTVQGNAQISGSVYGGGEIASVGRFHVVGGLPRNPQAGGTCTVKIQGDAKIGSNGTGHNVFGACKGVTPVYNNTEGSTDRSKSMQLRTNADKYYSWSDYNGDSTSPFIWVYYKTEDEYLDFLKTLALTSNTDVTIGGNSEVYGSVFGGGERGITLGGVDVNMTGGTVHEDVYGGGSLANSNTAMWDATNNRLYDYVPLELIPGLSHVTGYYKGDNHVLVTEENAIAGEGEANSYSAIYKTIVNLMGGMIKGDAYGGGLGQLGNDPIEAKVYGDVFVNQGTANDDEAPATAYTITYLTDNSEGKSLPVVNSGRIFGCNNLNGSPKGNVTVTVNRTVTGKDGNGNNITRTVITRNQTTKEVMSVATPHTYEVAAVYGGGNLADYTPENGNVKVRISSCDVSIEEVYGGGNAAMVPGTDVLVTGAHEIEHVFGGGNGEDKYYLNGQWNDNPGANVNGNANTLLKGGLIHEAYGGSNDKGTITGDITIDTGTDGLAGCPVKVDKLVGAGKNADVNGNLIIVLGCYPTTKTPLIFAGADNANVNGDVELTITSGTFGQVFGGNNEGGAIRGHIKLNIEETGCNPIVIDELYLGGNNAAYSRYGYYVKTNETEAENGNGVGASGETAILTNEKLTFIPRTSATDKHLPVKTYEKNGDTWTWTTDDTTGSTAFEPYEQPELNVTSCTSIGEVFGGGYGVGGKMYADPTVNINMIPGEHAQAQLGGADKLGAIGKVYGGGNAANVYGDATVNIGTAETVLIHKSYDKVTKKYTTESKTVTGANITGNVYGGGKKADVGQYDVDNDHVDVACNTYVNIGAKEVTVDNNKVWQSVAEGVSKVIIAGNVFGGGEGEAAESGAGAFKCAKAIVTGGTNIHIGNGTINGTVYGGGEVGRVEGNSVVAIGIGAGGTTPASAPEVKGNVFGAGKGKKTHGYSALLRGNPTVTIEGDAKVRGSVYGGGEIASVGKYNVKKGTNNPEGAPDDVLVGMPYSLANSGSGYCTVVVQGNAEIGPETEMSMTKTGGPDNTGHVFGAGKGVLPYDGYGVTGDDWIGDPWRVSIDNEKDIFNSSNTTYTTNYEKEYFKYIETLALATETNVTIGGNAFVKGSVYGGSQNGRVQHDTHVNIAGGQIGQGEGVTTGRYTSTDWNSEYLAECPHWEYVESSGAPYDPLATTNGTYDYTNYGFVPTADRKDDSDGGLPQAQDGHTFYGNVFGGGSGVIPYAPGLWHRGAGSVGGDTYVNITDGHILSSVYGGNEHTDVGTYTKDASGQPTTTPAATNARGKCTVNMTGGTVGVPRTDAQKQAHPLVGNVFGAGKGDQRIFFNTWTNVINTEVNISGNARIYGSVFGGGEDGHVIGDAETNIGGTVTIGTTNYTHPIETSTTNPGVIIGTTGTSYNDGNVFGGGRGFSGEAQTAGTVGGNVRLNINAGSVYGSVYGGGRLASVGTMFEFPTLSDGSTNPAYGQFKEDVTGANAKTYGHVTINISGGTIGNPAATGEGAVHSGNVFGGSMGRLNLLNGTRNPIWPKMAQVKETNVNIYGTAVVRRSVYGGGELGTVRDNAYVTIGGQKTADADDDGNVGVTSSDSDSPTVRRDVYGGGYGSEDRNYTIFTIPELKSATDDPNDPDSYDSHTYAFTPMQFAGCVGKNTYVNVAGGYIRKSVYGGGEMASVGVINYRAAELSSGTSTEGKVYFHDAVSDKDYYYTNMVKHGDATKEFALSWPYKFEYVDGFEGATHVNIKGGRLGLKTDGSDNDATLTDNGDVYGAGKGKAGDYKDYLFCANVGSTDVKIAYTTTPDTYSDTGDCIAGAVYGGGEDGHVMGNTKLTISGGLIYHSVYGAGSGKGTFEATLVKIGKDPDSTLPADHYTRDIYSITAGKVFGNSTVEMSGGYVVRNVYGGGNMGSVGKGNYAGGTDDYSTNGYGEKVTDLWSNEDFLGSGICTVKITGGTIGYINPDNPKKSMYPLDANKQPYAASLPYGNVFGGCRGESAPNITESPRYLYSPEFFVGYANETHVTIESETTKILGSVYGGGMDGHVRRDAEVIIKGGNIGIPYTAENQSLVKTSDLNDVQWLARGNVYGAGSGIGMYKYDFDYDGAYTSTVTYNGKQTKEEDNSTSAGSVTRFTKVEIKGGNIYRNVYGGGSLSTVGAPKIPVNNVMPPDLYRKGDTAEGHGEGKQTLNEVIIAGGQIGDDSSYDSNGNHKYGGHVYGGSRGSTDLDNSFSTAFYTAVNIIGDADIKGDVYGGGEAGTVKGDVDVNIAGGTIGHDVYGGGALADTQTSNWNATAGDWVNAKKSALYQTKVNILGGTISGDAYGGGLGRQETGTNNQPGYIAPIEAKVYGDVYVNLNGFDKREVTYDPVTHGATGDANGARLVLDNNEYLVKDDVKGAVVSRIFGCNNLNGSPQGSTKVHVFKTQNKNATQITNPAEGAQTAKVEKRYDLEAVYGGGNMAAYEPKDLTNGKTQVIIDGCDRTSINQVYGGGNAASTPATDVEVLGTYEIFELFGGGNGADDLPDGSPNPGANVGYKDYHLVENNSDFATKDARVNGEAFAAYRYGTGVATVDIKGGTIHRVFGGSNTKGNVRQTALTLLEEESGCPFCVDEAYGGGKSAPMDAEAQLHMACIPGLKEAYGGAEAADIQSDVTLNITNGTFNRVFGGNNISGTIRGSITVNIEETGCKPIIIGELYGGGNQAGYSIYGYKEVTEGTNKVWRPRLPEDGLESGMSDVYDDPVVNVKSFTSIGNVYGGGYGSSAEMVGSPTVNVNVTEDDKTDAQTYTVKVDHDNNADTPEIDAFVSDYAEGSVTLDEGLPTEHTVTLPSHEHGKMGAINNVFGGGNAAKVIGNTYVNIGTLNEVEFETTTDAERTKTVKGADIRGNVYGGGNAAEVTGNTNVVIGKEKTTTTTTTP